MPITSRNLLSSGARLGVGVAMAALIAVTDACTFDVDDDRAAARRIAERIEISVDDAIACIEFADGRANFAVEPCAS